MEYQFQTTFWDDFTIAEKFGGKAVEDTFVKAFEEWRHDYAYLTELVLVLNWKMWDWHQAGDNYMSGLYHKFWEKANNYGITHLKGEQLSYFIRTLD